jgi:NADH:ubiquinone oxidoreductase subunit 4 (subunit M)
MLLLAALVVLLGCAPQLLLRWIESAIRVSGL